MKLNDGNKFCNDLNSYILHEFKYKKPPLRLSRFNHTMHCNRVKIDLYLRWQPSSNSWKDDTLVIAIIGFSETRKGHGTRLLNYLLQLANVYNYKQIIIESTNDDSSGFAQKNGFTNVKDTRHWQLTIK